MIRRVRGLLKFISCSSLSSSFSYHSHFDSIDVILYRSPNLLRYIFFLPLICLDSVQSIWTSFTHIPFSASHITNAADPFAFRQFDDPKYSGTKISNMTKEAFVERVNQCFEDSGRKLHDGYAPFCKHVFVPNFAGSLVNALKITPENESLLRSGYEARTPKELPVLSRWFPKELISSIPEAKFLDIILYSREQIIKENEAMGNPNVFDEPWGIVAIKSQDVDFELPMSPITMMRNCLGVEHGGSGVPLEREKYMESVNFWKENAIIQ